MLEKILENSFKRCGLDMSKSEEPFIYFQNGQYSVLQWRSMPMQSSLDGGKLALEGTPQCRRAQQLLHALNQCGCGNSHRPRGATCLCDG